MEGSKLYHNRFKPLFRFFYYKNLPKAEIEDLVQDTFLRFFENYTPSELSETECAKILYGIAKNVYRESIRNIISQATLELDEDCPDLICESDYEDDHFASDVQKLQRELRAAIDELSPAQRAVMIGRFVDGKARGEVAVELGISEKHVHVNQRRAIAALKKRFEVV